MTNQVTSIEQSERLLELGVPAEKDCYYEQALNMKNFIKRLRRRGIVGMDEEVKLEKYMKW